MRTRTRTILAGLVLAAALVGGVAWATIPADSGLYTACKLNATGTIRLIDPSGPSGSLLSRCTKYETQITWNQKGVKGEPGASGATGTDGAKGDPCSATDPACVGPKGNTGAAGANGTDGTNGVPGTKGDPCLPETRGCQGPQGEPGAIGPQGPKGDPGAQGDPGTTGTVAQASATYSIPALSAGGSAFAPCPPAHPRVVGGGFQRPDAALDFVMVSQSRPLDDGSGWEVRFRNTAGTSYSAVVYAICVA